MTAPVVADPSVVPPDKHPEAPKNKRMNSRVLEPAIDMGEIEQLAHAFSPEPEVATLPPKTTTPPTRAAAARGRSGPAGAGSSGLPDAPFSPSKGCKPEELRVWAAKTFMKLEETIEGMRKELSGQKAKEVETRKGLETLNKKFEVIHSEHEALGKVNVKAVVMELEAKVESSANLATKINRDSAMDLHKLRGQLSECAARIDANDEWLKKVDADFKDHLEGNFGVLEKRVRRHSPSARSHRPCREHRWSQRWPGRVPP